MPKSPVVLVCVTVQRSCEKLIHAGAEIAKEKEAELSVVHVSRMGDNFLGSAFEGEALESLYKLSKEYNADMLLLRNDDVVNTLAAHARKIGACCVVIGGSGNGGGKLFYSLQNALPQVPIRVLLGAND